MRALCWFIAFSVVVVIVQSTVAHVRGATRSHVHTIDSIKGSPSVLDTSSRMANPESPQTRRVFAYYFLATFTYRDDVDGFKKDIHDAQAIGIDGFAVAASSWSAEPIYKTRMANMFEAARQLGADFKLFVCPEVGTGISAADVKDMVNLYKEHPNYYLDAGLPLLITNDGKYGNGSTSADGQSFWQSEVFTPGFNVSFYPGFSLFRSPGGLEDSGNPTYSELSTAFNSWWKDTVRGLFYFSTFGSPSNVVASQEAYAQVMRENNRQYMASVNGYYSRNILNEPADPYAWETFGGEGMAQQWASIIDVQKSPWVIIVTWNDLNETYHTPALVSEMYDHYAGQHAPRHTHVGFAQLLKYFIQWYKTGQQLVPTNDQIFYFYRNHSKDLVPTNPQTPHYFNFVDDIFVTSILAAPATVRVTSGGNITDTSVPAGLSHIRVPFSAGSQNIKLIRGSSVLINLDGEPVVTSITNYDMNPTTAYGAYP
jgi:glucan endo-1,3-alpha-glucosidase